MIGHLIFSIEPGNETRQAAPAFASIDLRVLLQPLPKARTIAIRATCGVHAFSKRAAALMSFGLQGAAYLRKRLILVVAVFVSCDALSAAQTPPETNGSNFPVIPLAEALSRAERYGAQVQAADILARLAHEDFVQARAATLPTVNGFNQFIYTEGNGTPSGVFVANDGVHVYNEQLQAHEELLSFIRRGELRAASAAEAVAKAKADLARRGLKVTVIQDYYGVVVAEHKIANAKKSLDEANRFLDITQKQEQRGEAAHADVLKAQITAQQRQRDVEDATLAGAKAKVVLAILIFPQLSVAYGVVDDLGTAPPPPSAPEQAPANFVRNPDVVAAQATFNQAKVGVAVARYAYLPSLGLDVFYGIDANQFAARTDYPTPESGRSTLPNYLVPTRQNLGYSAQATLNIPLWNWGSTRSKVKQASLRATQAQADLDLTRKQLDADLTNAYQEANAAFKQVDSLRSSTTLSDESLRLTILRYQAGEATALEIVDAQTTAALARNAYDDGLFRYRNALAALQSLTGTLP